MYLPLRSYYQVILAPSENTLIEINKCKVYYHVLTINERKDVAN